MVYTFKGLRDEVLRHLDEVGDSGTTRALAKDLINVAHQNRCMQFRWSLLVWDLPLTFTTEAGRQVYPLHMEFMRPLYFWNRTTKTYLKEVPHRQLGPEGYDWNNSTGSAEHFVLWGRTQVKRQPTSASFITIVSSSGADIGSSFGILIRGEDANGDVLQEIILPNGMTPVNSVNQYRKIMSVTKAGEWTGTMTMTSNSGAVENLKLQNCEMGKMYQQLFLLQNPAAGEVIEYRFFRQPLILVNDFDIPDVPAPFSQILVYDALVLMAGYNTELNAQAVDVWRQMQASMEKSMLQSFQEGQSLEARVRTVRYGQVNTPRAFTS